MPTGVQVKIAAVAGGGGGDPTLPAQFFLSGLSERGDVAKPIIARSYSEFVDLTGPRIAAGSAHDAVRAFFAENEGVGRVVFARVVGAAATSASVTLKDRSVAPGINTLTVTAASPGAWGARLKVVVTDGVLVNTFDLAITFDDVTVETFKGLASPAAAATAAAKSLWVRITNLGSATAAPNNNPLAGTFALTGGADDTAAVGQAQLVTALDRFTSDYGPGIVAIPGQPQTVAASLAAHCAAMNRTGVVSPAAGTTPTSANALADGLRATANARLLRFVYPWVQLPADGEAAARTVSPEGAYAGRRAATIGRVGVWQPPAGELGQFSYVTGPETVLTAAQRDSAVDRAIVPIVAAPSPRIYGDRSLDPGEVTWRFGAYSDLINAIAYECKEALEPMVGRSIDGLNGAFFADLLTRLTGVLASYADQGGLAPGTDAQGARTDPGYVVNLSANTAATIGRGEAIADVSARPPGVAELITVRLTKTGFTVAA